jgi:hypothetical protein
VRRVGALSAAGPLVWPWRDHGLVALGGPPHAVDERHGVRVSLRDAGAGAAISDGVPVAGAKLDQLLVSVAGRLDGDQPVAVELGRELLWEGDFEDHLAGAGAGAGAGWIFTAPDEGITDRDPRGGALALALVRKSGNVTPATVRAAGLLTLTASHRYTFAGCWRLEGGGRATASLAVYPDRSFTAAPVAQVAAPDQAPGPDWSCFAVEYLAAAAALVRPTITLAPPAQGSTRLTVDDLSLVEWEPLPDGPLPVPNEWERVRCRAAGTGQATVEWVSRRFTP